MKRAMLIGIVLCAGGSAWGDEPYFASVGANLRAVSADGRIAAGETSTGAVRWTREGGLQSLGRLVGYTGTYRGEGISWDGVAISGLAVGGSAGGQVAWKWTAAGGMQLVGDLPGGLMSGEGTAVTGNGEYVIGVGRPGNGAEAFVWSESGGMVSLGRSPTGESTFGYGASYSGQVVIGFAYHDGIARPARWTQETGFRFLPVLPDGTRNGIALDCSSDGSSAVGQTIAGPGETMHAWIWREGEGTRYLSGFAANAASRAYAISADGRVVVGTYTVGSGPYTAFYWTEGTGPRDLRAVVSEAVGYDVGPLARPWGLSDDGRTIVGSGFAAHLGQGLMADVDNGSGRGVRDGAVTVDDLLYFLVAMEDGRVTADVDDGTFRGVPDAAVTVDDLIYFIVGYEGGR